MLAHTNFSATEASTVAAIATRLVKWAATRIHPNLNIEHMVDKRSIENDLDTLRDRFDEHLSRCLYYVDCKDWMWAEKTFVRIEYVQRQLQKQIGEFHTSVRRVREDNQMSASTIIESADETARRDLLNYVNMTVTKLRAHIDHARGSDVEASRSSSVVAVTRSLLDWPGMRARIGTQLLASLRRAPVAAVAAAATPVRSTIAAAAAAVMTPAPVARRNETPAASVTVNALSAAFDDENADAADDAAAERGSDSATESDIGEQSSGFDFGGRRTRVRRTSASHASDSAPAAVARASPRAPEPAAVTPAAVAPPMPVRIPAPVKRVAAAPIVAHVAPAPAAAESDDTRSLVSETSDRSDRSGRSSGAGGSGWGVARRTMLPALASVQPVVAAAAAVPARRGGRAVIVHRADESVWGAACDDAEAGWGDELLL